MGRPMDLGRPRVGLSCYGLTVGYSPMVRIAVEIKTTRNDIWHLRPRNDPFIVRCRNACAKGACFLVG
jgi:hypothetical protein